jgi:glycosyltransferase involved in cell wall biosynthesis
MTIKAEAMMSTNGKRVLMLIENSTYPHDPRVHLEAVTLSGAGYQVSVICPSSPGQPRRQVIDGVCVYRYPAPPKGNSMLSYLWEYGYSLVATFIISLLVCFRPGFDVIHAANPPDTAVLIAAFYKLFSKRFIYDHHDLAPELYDARFRGKSSRFIRQALICFERLSCRLADRIITTNQSYKAMEMQRGSVPKERIIVVRNGPDLNRLRQVEPKTGLRQEGKINLIYVGVIERQDGVDYLIRSLQHLMNDLKRSDFYCIIVGEGGALADVEILTRQLGLSNYVFFTGFVEPTQIASYLCAGDIGVAPEPSNPLNDRSTMIKIIEYMALSKPIVAFDLPEHRISAGEAAMYARPNDELDFARQVSALMDDPERREKMGQIGRQRVENVLAWPYQAINLLDAYESIASRRGQVRSPNG